MMENGVSQSYRSFIVLGYTLKGGKRWLTGARKRTVTQIPVPTTPKQDTGSFTWTPEHLKAFKEIKKALLSAPALALPDLTKPFTLYVDNRAGVARGVLTQTLGPWKWPIVYLSKKLDPVASGWPSCLKAISAVALLLKDADKLTLGQQTIIVAPHALESIIRQPPDCWMTNACMTHYQSLLLTERVLFAPLAILNPATLLPEADESAPIHQCIDILAEEPGTRKDLTDQLWPGCPSWYTDGSRFMVKGKRRAGVVVVDGRQTIWASSLPEGISGQKAELIALIQALKLAEGKMINIYMDSGYAFATTHVHGDTYKQRGLLTSTGKDIKIKEEILSLLEAIHVPKKLAIIHCPGHQKGHDAVTKGNKMADSAAKHAAQGVMVFPVASKNKETIDDYDIRDTSFRGGCPYSFGGDNNMRKIVQGYSPYGVAETEEGKSVLSQKEGQPYVANFHQLTHLGTKKVKDIVHHSDYYVMGLTIRHCTGGGPESQSLCPD
ncbi:uncharacterized protein LOC127668804 isoform X2 [Apodemus sylvaticus]|uniref:uncharacterized protein LOC127668804 isoform X2 n=1 Tax=Apodemus sylvaticus TaxID=10129 RepID=UPI002244A900|nr:uncharacterized protein LOC127668804 isoform X2 [Apodemus sylvaticus]